MSDPVYRYRGWAFEIRRDRPGFKCAGLPLSDLPPMPDGTVDLFREELDRQVDRAEEVDRERPSDQATSGRASATAFRASYHEPEGSSSGVQFWGTALYDEDE